MRAAALVALGTLCLARPAWHLWHSLRARDWSSAETVRTHWLMVAALWLSLIPVSLVSLVLFRVAMPLGSDLMLLAAGYLITHCRLYGSSRDDRDARHDGLVEAGRCQLPTLPNLVAVREHQVVSSPRGRDSHHRRARARSLPIARASNAGPNSRSTGVVDGGHEPIGFTSTHFACAFAIACRSSRSRK